MPDYEPISGPASIVVANSRTGQQIYARDWSDTSLGPREHWPANLVTTLNIVLLSPVPMAILWGADGMLLYNDGYARVAGQRHPELLGQNVIAGWPEAAAFNQHVLDVVLAGQTLTYRDIEMTLLRNNRPEQVWFNLQYSPILDPQGTPAGVLGIVSEITEQLAAEQRRERAEEELRAARDRSQGVLDNMGEAFVLIDRDLRIVDMNLEAMRLENRPRDQIIGKTHREAHPDASPVLDALYRQALAERRAVALEHRYRWPDGRDTWIDMRAYPVEDGLAIFYRDVTDRKQVESRLHASEARQRFLLELGDRTRRIGSPERVIEETARALGEYLSATRVVYAEIDEAQGQAMVRGQWTDAGTTELPDALTLRDFGLPLIDRLRAGGTLRVADVRADAHTGASLSQLGAIAVAALVSVPLLTDGRLTVSLNVHDDRPRVWTDDEIALIEAIAERTREAVERIRTDLAAAAAIAESEARFRTMADQAPVMMWVTDPAGRCTYMNARWYEFTGQPAGAGENYGWLDAVHPEDRPAAEAAFVTANREQRNYRVDFRLRRADGVYRWTIDAAAARFSSDGTYLGYVGSVIDIEDRKAIEGIQEQRIVDALAEKRLFGEIVEATDATVQVVDADLRFVALNEAGKHSFERLVGVRPQVGESIADLLEHLPPQREVALNLWRRALAGEAFTMTGWWGDDAFDRRAFEARFRPLVDSSGKPAGAFVFAQDVTDRLREQERLAATEAARREADALYRAYFENTAEALFVIKVLDDGSFSIEDLNPAHQASVGMPLADVAGKRIDEALPGSLSAEVSSHYRRVLATREAYQYRERFELDGRLTYWDTVLVPVFDEQGRIIRLIGSSRDLTRQLAAEEQLRQSQKMEAMGQLTGGVAHDFNNLLTPIIGSLDMLIRRGLGSAREQRLIGGAMQAAERAATLVQRLLAFARRQPLQASAVDLRSIVANMAGLIGSTLGPTVDVRLHLAEDLPPAHADINQLEMALLNLAVNARDAMPDGGTLTITATGESVEAGARPDLQAGQYVCIAVKDTGTGMDAETLNRAVEPFFSTKGVGKGTGLGLSMVHGLAAQLGGSLTLSSELGRGTAVALWLPVSDGRVDAGDVVPATAPAFRTRGRVVLVDDEQLVRMSTADMLAELGYDVVEASSGDEALRLIGAGDAIDLLVTDHLMPGMNGVELARHIRRLKPDLPVLIVSGYAEIAGLAVDLPRLTKPFRQVDLAMRLAALMPETL